MLLNDPSGEVTKKYPNFGSYLPKLKYVANPKIAALVAKYSKDKKLDEAKLTDLLDSAKSPPKLKLQVIGEAFTVSNGWCALDMFNPNQILLAPEIVQAHQDGNLYFSAFGSLYGNSGIYHFPDAAVLLVWGCAEFAAGKLLSSSQFAAFATAFFKLKF